MLVKTLVLMCFCYQHKCVFVCQTHTVWANASDSVLNGSGGHMATCQQATGGNIILKRKAAVISACVRGHSEAGRTVKKLCTADVLSFLIWFYLFFCFVTISLFALCLFSPCTLTSPFTAEFSIALECLQQLLCSKHTKVSYSRGSMSVFCSQV